jgi:8-oxo-dGTP pyrophosphatase MutT (NUDIX family)
MGAPDPAARLEELTGDAGNAGLLIDSFGHFPTVEDIRRRIRLIDEVIDHSPLPEPLLVNRGLDRLSFMDGFAPDDPRSLEGTVQTEPGYLSTSLGADTDLTSLDPHPFHLHLTLPAGARGFWLGPNSAVPDQRELLLPRDTRYLIERVTHQDGRVHIDARVLLPAPGEGSDGGSAMDDASAVSGSDRDSDPDAAMDDASAVSGSDRDSDPDDAMDDASDGSGSDRDSDPDASGDGWVDVPDGTQRWGRYGAAGLLLYSTDAHGTPHVLLQHRGAHTDMGGTWGIPGGARDRDETPLQGALREFGEEVAGAADHLDGIVPLRAYEHDLTTWRYDTYLAHLPGLPDLRPSDDESQQIRWVPAHQVDSLDLHPAFRTTWDQARQDLGLPAPDAAAEASGNPPPDGDAPGVRDLDTRSRAVRDQAAASGDDAGELTRAAGDLVTAATAARAGADRAAATGDPRAHALAQHAQRLEQRAADAQRAARSAWDRTQRLHTAADALRDAARRTRHQPHDPRTAAQRQYAENLYQQIRPDLLPGAGAPRPTEQAPVPTPVPGTEGTGTVPRPSGTPSRPGPSGFRT